MERGVGLAEPIFDNWNVLNGSFNSGLIPARRYKARYMCCDSILLGLAEPTWTESSHGLRGLWRAQALGDGITSNR